MSDVEVLKLKESHTAELEAKDSEIFTLTRSVDTLKEVLSAQHDELSSAVRSKDEMISSADEKHRFEIAAITERFEKKICELEQGHHRTVEEYCQRIAAMEQSDVELNTQLIAVTEKFNSVTEYTANAERVIEDYRLKADKWAAEREEIVKFADTARATLSDKEAEIITLKEEIQLLKQPVHDRPVPNVKNVETETADICEAPSPRLYRETYSLDNSHGECDELVKVQQENYNLTQQQADSTASLKEQHENVIEHMRSQHRAVIHDLEEQHNLKVVKLIKDLNAQMAAHEKGLQESMQNDLGW